jgi:hypothetical protein
MPGREERETSDSSRRQLQGLPVIRRNVAGIDLGSERHWMCAPTLEGSDREVTSFGATTGELIRMAEWRKARQVESVAMESTGGLLDCPTRGAGSARSAGAAGGHTTADAGAGTGQEIGPDRLRVDPTAAQLRLAAGFVPAGRSDLHAAHVGAG